MGKYSNPGMGGAQNIFSVGHIPTVSGYKAARSPKSQKSKLRALNLCAAEHGLFLKVGPLLYKMDDAVGFFKRLDEVASEESGGFARKFIHQMYTNLGQQRHYVRKGYPRRPMWVSVAQKAALFGKP
jgi:hypothetical protein